MNIAPLTTMRVGGPAKAVIEVASTEDLILEVAERDRVGEPVLILGSGSNVVVSDEGFDGTVIRVETREVTATRDGDEVRVRVDAGVPWDAFVAGSVADEWSGLECLSGIPGRVGATPIQNVGAYGHEVAEFIESVEVLDRKHGKVLTLLNEECGFGYRSSRFKSKPKRYVVLAVNFKFEVSKQSAPIRYQELAEKLGVVIDECAVGEHVRRAVLELRRAKGMVLDIDDHDTWSVGSFFTNPIVEAGVLDQLPEDAPRWSQDNGLVKLSAGWLISHAGYDKGWPHDDSAPASLSTKHSLAITNRGQATTEDVLNVARSVRDGVNEKFGVLLEPEARLIGCELG